MAAAATSSPSGGGQPRPEQAAGAAAQEQDARWQPVLGLPCQLTIDLPLPNFKVADFLRLRLGSVISTRWRLSREVPLRINGTLIGWGELEGSGNRLAVRLTELA
ncbi:MAG TPA: FliM/FliN family flagellar motor C-terminal domain-containing protein [Candidatus Acidoferrales bacterium]|nr:FliM/FliN family flagellar motor C-terminal domain-containing protein [Candidatus Acidoferrales bacterium]